MNAVLLHRERLDLDDGSIVEMVPWVSLGSGRGQLPPLQVSAVLRKGAECDSSVTTTSAARVTIGIGAESRSGNGDQGGASYSARH